MRRIRHRISIERDDFERVAWQGEAPNFRGAAIQNMKKNALALLDSDRFAVAKHATVNGKEPVTNFVSVRHALGERSFHGGFASFLESFVCFRRRQKILRHVATAAESRLEFLQNKKNFAIIAAWIFVRLDVNGSNLAAVLAGRKIGPSAIVCVIET